MTAVTSTCIFLCVLIFTILRNNVMTGNGDTTGDVGFDSPPDLVMDYSPREPKFFPLAILRFNNDKCKINNGEEGVCYTRQQCSSLGGVAIGICALNFGVCCQFQAACNSMVTQNGTLYRNPKYPEKETSSEEFPTGICAVRIRKQDNFCQVRLIFRKFDILGPVGFPTTAHDNPSPSFPDVGMCKKDGFMITASGINTSPVCGDLTGQHMYIDFGPSDTISLYMILDYTAEYNREWNIEIEMIPCNSVSRAPDGCLQYFTGISGKVESFNYAGGTHLANQDYSICIRREAGMRSIEWRECNPGSVKIYGESTASTDPMCPAPEDDLADYLIIMGGIQHPQKPSPSPGPPSLPISIRDRFCDASFSTINAFVRSTVHPFILHFKTDGSEKNVQQESSVGLCVRWQQNPYA